jgi:hypothetical protein
MAAASFAAPRRSRREVFAVRSDIIIIIHIIIIHLIFGHWLANSCGRLFRAVKPNRSPASGPCSIHTIRRRTSSQ